VKKAYTNIKGRYENIVIKSRRMRWAGHVARMGGRRGMHIGYWWESEKERGHWERRHRWVEDIKMDLREIEWNGMNWVHLPQDRDQLRALVKTVMNLGFHKMLGSC
jgi:hypothetical protein